MVNTHNIKIYTAPGCVYCKATKDLLDKHNIEYTEYNVAEDEKALGEMVIKSGQMGVPVIDIDGQVFVGFNRNGIMEALGISE